MNKDLLQQGKDLIEFIEYLSHTIDSKHIELSNETYLNSSFMEFTDKEKELLKEVYEPVIKDLINRLKQLKENCELDFEML